MMKLDHMVEGQDSHEIHRENLFAHYSTTARWKELRAEDMVRRNVVWSLEVYSASATLQEMLTIKSGDISGRQHRLTIP